MSLPTGLLNLNDNQLAAVMNAASPIPPTTRGAFLEAVARKLADEQIVGDGTVARVCRDLQRSYFNGVAFERGGRVGVGKYG